MGSRSLGLKEMVSFTAEVNERSWKVMERLRMKRAEETFMHPLVDAESHLAKHVLYKIKAAGASRPITH